MIAMLRGKVVFQEDDWLVVDVGGVGWRVFVPGPVQARVGAGDEVLLHISTQVREDSIHLYGFESPVDRDTFLTLLGVSGVGVKTALSILSTWGRKDLGRILAEADARSLEKVPGIGKRLAQRLVVELAGRIAVEPVAPAPTVEIPASDPLPLALARLGFRRTEIETAMLEMIRAGTAEGPLEKRIGEALRILGRA